MNRFVLKGDICYNKDRKTWETIEGGYVVCEDGVCKGAFAELPAAYQDWPMTDYGHKLIIPGLMDIHLHAPQFAIRALGMDLELIEWLDKHAFNAEANYADLEYADMAYDLFVEEMLSGATTRLCTFGTLHKDATLLLMEKLEKAGFHGFVGKVNMDRNSPDILCEESAAASLAATESFIQEAQSRFQNIKPVITPRFTPSCSDELMQGLGELQAKYGVPAQSHLSENLSEIAWVQELCPGTTCYGDAYDQFGLFGSNGPTIMAHCVHSGEKEQQMMLERGTFVAHCPQSNSDLASGIAPIRQYLNRGIQVGLGSDVAGGHSYSIFEEMKEAIQVSKLRWRLVDQSLEPLTVQEAFYLGTKGGGAFFGKVGSLEDGYRFDAVVMDDSAIKYPRQLSIEERMERLIYLAEKSHVYAKYIDGRKVK
ncbi:MAG: amidohydrolase family protein [Firmicutes bacterium]|nr:amidohydrolase family protein [Bacillota bacterium]